MTMHWLGWVLSAIVLVLLFFIGKVLEPPARLLLTGERTQGVVVGMESRDSLCAPIVQFTTAAGQQVRVSGRNYSRTPSIKPGDPVTVVYDPAEPAGAHLLLAREFVIVAVLLGFIILIVLLWVSVMLLSPESEIGDPFHILSSVIANLKLSPARFPLYFLLPLVIFCCALGTYVTFKDTFELRSNGVKVKGQVTGIRFDRSKLSDGTYASGSFAEVLYRDVSGTEYTIRRSLAKPLSRLKSGDIVEVIYPPRHPDLGRVNTWDEMYPPTVFFAFMLVAFTFMLTLVIKGRIP